MEKEIWKSISTHEGFYKISNHGRVFSIKTKRFLKSRNNKVILQINKSKTPAYVSKLVADHFIPKIHNKRLVCHKDGNIENNKVSNLAWRTKSEVIANTYKLGRIPAPPWGQKNAAKKVYKYNLKGKIVKKYPSHTEAAKSNNVSIATISRITKLNLAYRGFIFKTIDA